MIKMVRNYLGAKWPGYEMTDYLCETLLSVSNFLWKLVGGNWNEKLFSSQWRRGLVSAWHASGRRIGPHLSLFFFFFFFFYLLVLLLFFFFFFCFFCFFFVFFCCFFGSPEPSGSQGELIVYPYSGVSSTMFKHLLLWNRFANQSQILCGASLGRGNESLYKWSRAHDQDGRHAHI